MSKYNIFAVKRDKYLVPHNGETKEVFTDSKVCSVEGVPYPELRGKLEWAIGNIMEETHAGTDTVTLHLERIDG